MKNSTIATLLLVGIPFVIALIASPILLAAVAFISLGLGFTNLLMIASIVGGWYLFWSIAWMMFWFGIITIVPSQREIWLERY